MAERETDEARAETADEQRGDSGGDGAQAAEHESRQHEGDDNGRSNDGEQKSEKEKRAEEQRQEREKRKKQEEEDDGKSGFSVKRLHWAELVGFAGSIVLAASLFLNWFATDCVTRAAARAGEECNPNSVYNGQRGEFDAFETFGILDWILVAACVAPFILAYIIARAHKLSWKPGEVTMIVGMIAVVLILLNGVILGKPGDTVDMHFEIGWLIGLIGATLIMLGGILRQALTGGDRKPPGVM